MYNSFFISVFHIPRFLVHRYSVLQQHAEANGFEGLDIPGANKTGYHDDSDEASGMHLSK